MKKKKCNYQYKRNQILMKLSMFTLVKLME